MSKLAVCSTWHLRTDTTRCKLPRLQLPDEDTLCGLDSTNTP